MVKYDQASQNNVKSDLPIHQNGITVRYLGKTTHFAQLLSSIPTVLLRNTSSENGNSLSALTDCLLGSYKLSGQVFYHLL